MGKLKVAILGSGNIGTDLMLKLRKSEKLELTSMIGIDPKSDGLRHARRMGYEIFDAGIHTFLKQSGLADLVFDATSAKAHLQHAKQLEEAGIVALDLTPAAVGPFVVPTVNLDSHRNQPNVNLITCGGQATIPIIHAISQAASIHYAEIVATISSKSAGPGTRANIDEFTRTTARGIEIVGGARKGKAIIVLNPAEPPILMRDTIYCLVGHDQIDKSSINLTIQRKVSEVQTYIPGYRLRMDPIFEGNKITVMVEVEGAGDYLPKYAGNLDIMTASAVKVAEEIAALRLETY